MITFSKLGIKGRLGNQLFQYAAMIGFAKKYNQKLVLRDWVYSKYFEYPHPVNIAASFIPVKESAYHYTPEFYDGLNFDSENYDFEGYFQSEKYFSHCVKDVMKTFRFKSSYKDSVYKKYLSFFGKKTIAVSIRRGDFVDNPNYHQLQTTYYFSALEKFFPNWKENNNVIFFSDDIEYCKLHFSGFENIFFAENKFNNSDRSLYWTENESAIEQLCLMSMCDHFILSNSTFSWWGAYLGENSNSIIVRPEGVFSGSLQKHSDTKDYYPARWKKFIGEKIDLSDVTFMIPVQYDHKDRLENIHLNICLLQRFFNATIMICENKTRRFDFMQKFGVLYYTTAHEHFHRTRMLNQMAEASDTAIIVNWDADVFISPIQIYLAVKMIREGAAMVFPYNGKFARVPRIPFFKKLETSLDVGIFSKESFKGTFETDKLSVGGAIVFNKKKYFEGGGENENFVSYGPEDVERDVRFRRLGYDVRRVDCILYHLDHWRGPDSKSHGNLFHKQNHDELEKIYSLSQKELREYVNTWPQTTK